MAVIIKTLKTPGGNYVYDRYTNQLIKVNNEHFDVFQRIEYGNASDRDLQILGQYQKNNFCIDSPLKEIEHSETMYLPYSLESRMEQLIIQTGQRCTLNCSYCTYAGGYEYQREHSQKTMPLPLMLKTIDFFMARSWESESVTISLYGGEALLDFENIRASVEYVKENYNGRQINYGMTTNGTVISPEIAKFLDENNFSINISLDGPKEIHNSSRVFLDGTGSYDKIMENMEFLKIEYPKLYKNIRFMSVVAPGVDFSCVNMFFDAEDIMEGRNASHSLVNEFNAKNEVIYDDKYTVTYNYQQMKVLLSALGKYSADKVSTLFKSNLSTIERVHKTFSGGLGASESAHPGGPCVPGVMRLYVDVDGNLYPCEKVNECSDVMRIGNIEVGFDLDKAYALLNVGKTTAKECLDCWNFSHCELCCCASDGGIELSRKTRLMRCNGAKYRTYEILQAICLLLENGYDFDHGKIIERAD
ncbi:MAG: radical SAM protein [Firmicutes bacterium]|nr:radical SAM protein [Bacillota bacterium]